MFNYRSLKFASETIKTEKSLTFTVIMNTASFIHFQTSWMSSGCFQNVVTALCKQLEDIRDAELIRIKQISKDVRATTWKKYVKSVFTILLADSSVNNPSLANITFICLWNVKQKHFWTEELWSRLILQEQSDHISLPESWKRTITLGKG